MRPLRAEEEKTCLSPSNRVLRVRSGGDQIQQLSHQDCVPTGADDELRVSWHLTRQFCFLLVREGQAEESLLYSSLGTAAPCLFSMLVSAVSF